MRGLALVFVGCYRPPDLPLLDEVPIEPPDFIPCDEDLEDETVACVVDGDTFDYRECGGGDELRVRMLAIDAPEVSQPPDCFGPEAEQWLRGILEGETVTLTRDATCEDKFLRQLTYVWALGDLYDELARDRRIADLTDYRFGEEEPAVLVNEVVLRLGYARQYPEEFAGTLYYQDRLDAATAAAEADQLGLWSACR